MVFFILVSAFYFMLGMFNSIFRICIFVAFCRIQAVAFCGFLVFFYWIFQYICPVLAADFLALFVSFLAPFCDHLSVLLCPFLQCFPPVLFVVL